MTAPTTSAGAARRIHIGMSIRGALRRSDRELKGMFSTDDGREMPGADVRRVLKHQLDQGREVLPFAPKCDLWDYKTGCKGHPIAEEAADA